MHSEFSMESLMRRSVATSFLVLLGVAPAAANSQATTRAASAVPTSPVTLDSAVFGGLRWRELGPPRGGRSVAAAGSVARPNEYWFGTTGGGVMKTTDGGLSWTPMSDRFFGGTIGAIAVDARNPDVVWVGGGETCIRGNTAHGDGLWKTTDDGRTWTFLGFREEHIATIELDWRNSSVAYLGVFGNPFQASPNRGLYKTTDGGQTFNKALFVNDSTGVIDIQMDPTNPDILYVATWQAFRTPWSMSSGGVGSALHKSTDGGSTWTNLSRTARGFPKGVTGKIGIAVSPAKPSRIWAQVEHDSGGLYRSDDGGQSWEKLNADRRMMQRAWYYSHVYADPKDTNVVYSLNVGFHKSRDGGRTFPVTISVPHGDNHDLWIAPDDPNRMINANDGGANVSINGGQSWTGQQYATAQFYHVDVTNDWPYHVCGAQQDNSTLCGPSRGGQGIGDWYDGGGGESGYVTPNPRDPNIIFAGSYGGLLTRLDRRTGFERNVTVFPINPMGHSSEDIEVRFQWTFPIIFSRHTPNVVYAAGSKLFRSTTEGESWTAVSPDLARKDPRTMGPSGGPITRDQTGVETYGVIFAFDESPVQAGVLWAGTDDGLVWLSRTNGATWENVTPPGIGDFTRVSIIEPSHYVAGGAFVAANRYQQGDKQPIIYKTSDFGRTWTKIVNGIKADHFVRVVREDPVRRGLLFAGTERGPYVTFDEGLSWQAIHRNLPIVPIHDLRIKDNDVVLGTHGRSFWVMDNMSALREATPAITQKASHLFRPVDAFRTQFSDVASGAVVQYWLKDRGQRVSMEFLDARGAVIRSFSSDQDAQVAADSIRRAAAVDSLIRTGASRDSATRLAAAAQPAGGGGGGGRGGGGPPPRVPNQAGMNTFAWNLRYPDAERFTNLIMWAAGTTGPIAPPGTYSVRMTVGSDVQTHPVRVRKDPRSNATDADLQEQFRLLLAIRDKVSEANLGVRTVRNMRWQVGDRTERLTAAQRAEFARLAGTMMDSLTYRENEVYQTRNQSGQDPLNYPIRLNNKIAALSGVVGAGEFRPTQQSREAFTRLSRALDAELNALKQTMDTSLPALNAILRAAGLPELKPSTDEPPPRRGPIAM
jgi:photosystem II stability/assembly factor-like uncharacterized protein